MQFALLEGPEKIVFLRRLETKIRDLFNPYASMILKSPLPFYETASFYLALGLSNSPQVLGILADSESLYMLDGANATMDQANKAFGIAITRDNVQAYIDFFFTHTRGRHGRFVTLPTHESVALEAGQQELPADVKQLFDTMDQSILGMEDGDYVAERLLLFKDSLFSANIIVKSDGLVRLKNETLKFEGIGLLEDSWYPATAKMASLEDTVVQFRQ